MAIQLTQDFDYDPGHGKPVQTCAEVKIIRFEVDIVGKQVRITSQYGNHSNGVWIASDAPNNEDLIENTPHRGSPRVPLNAHIPADPAYDDLMASALTPAAGLPLYGVVGASLYQVLLDEGLYQGTIQL